MDFWDSWKGNLIGATIQLGRLERVVVTFWAAAGVKAAFYMKQPDWKLGLLYCFYNEMTFA